MRICALNCNQLNRLSQAVQTSWAGRVVHQICGLITSVVQRIAHCAYYLFSCCLKKEKPIPPPPPPPPAPPAPVEEVVIIIEPKKGPEKHHEKLHQFDYTWVVNENDQTLEVTSFRCDPVHHSKLISHASKQSKQFKGQVIFWIHKNQLSNFKHQGCKEIGRRGQTVYCSYNPKDGDDEKENMAIRAHSTHQIAPKKKKGKLKLPKWKSDLETILKGYGYAFDRYQDGAHRIWRKGSKTVGFSAHGNALHVSKQEWVDIVKTLQGS